MCVFMTIQKEELEAILDNYPQQAKFLRAIGRQRLQTTKPEDLNTLHENIFEVEDGQNVFVNKNQIENASGDLSKGTIDFLANSLRKKSSIQTVTEVAEEDDSLSSDSS
jgi:hypothetical protein